MRSLSFYSLKFKKNFIYYIHLWFNNSMKCYLLFILCNSANLICKFHLHDLLGNFLEFFLIFHLDKSILIPKLFFKQINIKSWYSSQTWSDDSIFKELKGIRYLPLDHYLLLVNIYIYITRLIMFLYKIRIIYFV